MIEKNQQKQFVERIPIVGLALDNKYLRVAALFPSGPESFHFAGQAAYSVVLPLEWTQASMGFVGGGSPPPGLKGLKQACQRAVRHLQRETGLSYMRVYCALGGDVVRAFRQNVTGLVRDPSRGVSEEEVSDLLTKARFALAEDQCELSCTEVVFFLDQQQRVNDPVGRLAHSLTLERQLYWAPRWAVHCLAQLIQHAGADVEDVVAAEYCEGLAGACACE